MKKADDFLVQELGFTFLDVGQGDGTVIQFPTGHVALVDLGSKKNAHIAGQDAVGTVCAILKEKGKSKIDYLFLTHGDGDHFNLLGELKNKGVSFGHVYFGGKKIDYSLAVVRAILASNADVNGYCKPFNKPVELFGTGYCSTQPLLTVGGVNIYVLAVNVSEANKNKRKNAGSLVLMFEYGDHKIILMGDAEPSTENFIMKNFKEQFLKATLLKLAHHGSRGSNSLSWLKTVEPRIVVASADQKWGHPDKEALDRVRSVGSLGHLATPHSYVQSHYSKNDYLWETLTGKEAILTNLFKIEGQLGKGWSAEGTAYHVEFGNTGQISVGHTFGKSFSLFEPSSTDGMWLKATECMYDDALDADADEEYEMD